MPATLLKRPPLNPRSSKRGFVKVDDEYDDDGMPVVEWDCADGSPDSSSSHSRESGNEKHEDRRGLLSRSKGSLRDLLVKSGSQRSLVAKEDDTDDEEDPDKRSLFSRSKGSLRDLFGLKHAPQSRSEIDDDDDEDEAETPVLKGHKGRRRDNADHHHHERHHEKHHKEGKGRVKHHKRVGSFDQLLGRGGPADEKRGPPARGCRSNDNLDRMRRTLREQRGESVRNVFRNNSFRMKKENKPKSSRQIAEMVMAEFCDFED